MKSTQESALYLNHFLVDFTQEYLECAIKAIPVQYDFKPYAYGFQKDSPFLEIFNFYIREMQESGSLQQVLQKYQSQPQLCEDYSGKPLGNYV